MDVSEASELVEVPPEEVSGAGISIGSMGNPRTPSQDVMHTIESWACEVLVERMDGESFERVDRS